MEFDKSRVFSAVNADELRVGDKVIVANNLADLKEFVRKNDVHEIEDILSDCVNERFGVCGMANYALAYLVERAEPKTEQKAEPNCENCIHLCKSVNPCLRYEPKTNYRPFKDVEELLDHWYDKTGMKHPDGLIYGVSSLTMPRIWVQSKRNPKFKLLITEYDMGFQHLAVGNVWKDLEGLFNNYTFLDGSVCGVEE